jgi:hypothetical protein
MNVRHFFFLGMIFLFAQNQIWAQKAKATEDSLWCDHLNEIIKCASLDEISGRIGKVRDSSYIPQFKPALLLSTNPDEYINKQYGKVNYTCYFFISATNNAKVQQQFSFWYKKLKKCLSLWDEARFDNADKAFTTKDYFFTNSEDETSLRLDIARYGEQYAVRLRVY